MSEQSAASAGCDVKGGVCTRHTANNPSCVMRKELTDQDCEALGPFAWGLMILSDRPDAINAGRDLSAVVEAIVARHVEAALNAAADEVESAAGEYRDDWIWDSAEAMEIAARIVRAIANT